MRQAALSDQARGLILDHAPGRADDRKAATAAPSPLRKLVDVRAADGAQDDLHSVAAAGLRVHSCVLVKGLVGLQEAADSAAPAHRAHPLFVL